ncbi:unnamed protein product [Trichogramma brassicae]|uniref:Uncharacterized protein n=1 Tax=Trichogramma brassicae TaxID=86971 RepID=A0A6H5INK2_9HYME|nr:unnamed protein product [Trichogramma brassicae]
MFNKVNGLFVYENRSDDIMDKFEIGQMKFSRKHSLPLLVLLLLLLLLVGESTCQLESEESTRDYEAGQELEDDDDDSGSIEMPVRIQRETLAQHRPIIELVLGVLDTVHSSSQSDLKRIQARHAKWSEVATSSATSPTRRR